MFKPCPNCGFLVALIAGREASQRCPRCGSAMLEDGEPLPADVAAPHGAGLPPQDARSESVSGVHHPDAVDASMDAAEIGDAPSIEPPVAPAPAMEPVGAQQHRAPEHTATTAPTPSFTRRRAHRERARGPRWPWWVALPLLTLLLALQLLLSQRSELAQNARWRPWLAGACAVLRCEVPAWREPRAFAMVARNVRPHATRRGVLHVTTSLRNDARWAQPLPVVVLSLSDVEGRVLAARAVPPAEYSRQPAAPVAPGDSVDIAFDVREPSPRVVSFDFQLR